MRWFMVGFVAVIIVMDAVTGGWPHALTYGLGAVTGACVAAQWSKKRGT